MNQNNSAATKNIAALVVEVEVMAAPWPCPLAAGAAAAGLAAAGGAADSFGAGGGQVMLPCLTTVVPRITSSSMLTLMTPSFALQSSSARRNRLVAYKVLDCLD